MKPPSWAQAGRSEAPARDPSPAALTAAAAAHGPAPGGRERRAGRRRAGAGKCLFAAGFVVGLAVQAGGRANAARDVPEVLLPGSYHADEVSAVTGPGWLALLVEPASALVPGELKITTVYDPVLDPAKGPFSGKQVSVEPSQGAVVLLKGAVFEAGPLSAATVAGEYGGLTPKIIVLDNQRHFLQLDGNCLEGATQCEWIFSDGSTRQVVGRLNGWVQNAAFVSEGGNTGLLWAGDLDRDGRLDLIIDVSDHYNAVAQVRVLLSSAAADGELLGEVASFSAVGC